MEPTYLALDWCGLTWTAFVPLPLPPGSGAIIPGSGGMYRVRVVGHQQLAYVGETGRNLLGRQQALGQGIRKEEMPFNDPHTAAPKLWSYRVAEGLAYGVSVAAVDLPLKDRRGLECYLLWKYRQEAGSSTLCNFGRVHPRYTTPSNTKGGKRGVRLPDGAPDTDCGPCMPALPDRGASTSNDWMGLDWSEWVPLATQALRRASRNPGVYRLADATKRVVYIGESQSLAKRLSSHCRHYRGSGILVSFAEVVAAYTDNQLHEVESDLIAGYYAEHRQAPQYQFGTKTKAPAEQ